MPAGSPDATCGTRVAYRRGCRCMPCRAAEAAYRRDLRLLHARGIHSWGMRLDAAEARQMLRAFRTEGQSRRETARRLGYLNPGPYRLYTQITVRRFLKLRRLYRLTMAEGPSL